MVRGLSSRDPAHRARSGSLGLGDGNRKQPVVAREELPTLGIDFVWVREALDTSRPMGDAMFTIVAAMREESGSITPMEWKAARQISFRTPILALNTRPGMVSTWRAVRVLKTNGQGGNQRGEHADPQPRQSVRDAQLPSLKQGEATSVLLVDAGVL